MNRQLTHEVRIDLAKADALVFDLGGVILDLDYRLVFDRWAELSGEPGDIIYQRFRLDASYERHERGEISGPEYFEQLRSTLGIDLSIEQFIDGWNSGDLGPIPGVMDILEQLSKRIPLYVLTNSNATHEGYWSVRYAAMLALFKSVFVSWRMGVRKPEAAIYRMVADRIGVPVTRIHFFDDRIENVRGAHMVGMPATHVASARVLASSVSTILRSRQS